MNFGQVNIVLAVFLVHWTCQPPHGPRAAGCADRHRRRGEADAPAARRLLPGDPPRAAGAVDDRLVPGVCSAIAWVVFPQASWIYWAGTFLESDRVGVSYISNQSMNGMLQRMLGDDRRCPDLARLGLAGSGRTRRRDAVLVLAHHLFGDLPAPDRRPRAGGDPAGVTDQLDGALDPDPAAAAGGGVAGPAGAPAAGSWPGSAGRSRCCYGVVRPSETAQRLIAPQEQQLLLANTFTWLTLLVGVGCVWWYWSRIGEGEQPEQHPAPG
jgi:hypothetical protein